VCGAFAAVGPAGLQRGAYALSSTLLALYVAGFVKRYGVCPSVCLARALRRRAARLLLWARQDYSEVRTLCRPYWSHSDFTRDRICVAAVMRTVAAITVAIVL